MIFSTVMTDFLKHFFLISRGLVELITPSQSRDLKKLTQIMKVLPSPMRVIKNILRSLKVFIKSYFVNSRHPAKRLII